MDDDAARYWFGDGFEDDDLDDCDDDELDPESPPTYEFVPLTERIEALLHANATAKRLGGTGYWGSAHKKIDRMLDDIIGR